MFGDRDNQAISVTAYFPNPLYFWAGERFGTFDLLDTRRLAPPTQSVVESATSLARREHRDVLMILNYELDRAAVKNPLTFVAGFTGSLWPDENFYLYRVAHAPAPQ